MFQKIIAFILCVLICSSCTNEYWQFHEQKSIQKSQKEELITTNTSFSIDQIEDRETEILFTPDKKVLDHIVTMIDNAKSSIRVEVYILTEKRIIKALKDAKSRGVKVQVVLEKNVFGGTSINTKVFKELSNAGIKVSYANNKLYVFTHTKTILIDDTYIITTGNLSYSSFTTNREFYIIGKNKDDLKALENILDADAEGKEIIESTNNLVISPINSRVKIESLISSAQKNLFLYAENFGDDSITSILEQKVKSKIPVIICMADPDKVKPNAKIISLLQGKGVDVRTSKRPAIHAKSVLMDESYSYIGSENFSTNSLDNNREI